MVRHILTFVLFCAISDLASAVLPDYIRVCKRDQSTINDCVLRNMVELRPYLAKGIKELRVPSIEPFYIPEFITISGELESLHASGKDLKVSGLSNYTIKSLHVDVSNVDTLTIRGKVRFPKIHFDGLYNVDTQIFVVPIKGQGTMEGDAVKCEADILMKSKVEKHADGKEYVKFTRAEINIAVKDYTIRLHGLFSGNKILGDATNEAINQNKQDFLKVTLPYLERTIGNLALNLANNVVESTSLDELLPKN